MYALMEKAVFIRARKVDNELVEKAAKEASTEFEKNAGFLVEVEIDYDNPLGAERLSTLCYQRQADISVLVESLFWAMAARLSMIIR
jgi:hypothetical protein